MTIEDVRSFLRREAGRLDIPPELWLRSFRRTNFRFFLEMTLDDFEERIRDPSAALAFAAKEKLLASQPNPLGSFFEWTELPMNGDFIASNFQEVREFLCTCQDQERALLSVLGTRFALSSRQVAVVHEVAARVAQIRAQQAIGSVATNRCTTVVVVGGTDGTDDTEDQDDQDDQDVGLFCRTLVEAVSFLNRIHWAWVSYKDTAVAPTVLSFPERESAFLVFGVEDLFALTSDPSEMNIMAWRSIKAGMKRSGTVGLVTAESRESLDLTNKLEFDPLNGTVVQYIQL